MLAKAALDGVFIACGVHKSHPRAHSWGRSADSAFRQDEQDSRCVWIVQAPLHKFLLKLSANTFTLSIAGSKLARIVPQTAVSSLSFSAQDGGCSINKVSPLLILK